MRPWVLGFLPWVLGFLVGALLAAGALTFMALGTTTHTTTVSVGAWSRGCGSHGAWPDPLSAPIDETSYTRAVRDGERVEITVPAGPYVMRVESSGTELAMLPSRAQPPMPPLVGNCASEPYIERYAAIGAGTFTVTYVLYA
jgi:hypothetical protein